MTRKLAIIVLGNKNTGKSETWKGLFDDRNIKTRRSLRPLFLQEGEYIDVFLINGSPEERGEELEDIMTVENDILLCSVQYNKHGLLTIKKIHDLGYEIYLHWLNPGYYDKAEYTDYLKIIEAVNKLPNAATYKMDGKKEGASERISLIKDYLYTWAAQNNKIKKAVLKNV